MVGIVHCSQMIRNNHKKSIGEQFSFGGWTLTFFGASSDSADSDTLFL